MPDKCPDIYQSTIFLSCFFPKPCSCWQYINCLWSQLSKCLLNVTHVFRQVDSSCCADKYCALSHMWIWCVGAWLRTIHTDVQGAPPIICIGVWVHVCTHLSTSLIQRGINPIHYLAGRGAAQSMALSEAADELPSLTRCIIQTCHRPSLCLASQGAEKNWRPDFFT